MVVLTYVASAIRNGTPELESFPRFYEHWLLEQNKYLEDLISVFKLHNKSIDTNTSQTSTLINQVIEHYEHYYEVMSRWAKQYVLGMLTPSWTSTLEEGFMWIGGWRPTMAFHLLYSKSGLQLEDQLADFIRGLSTGDLGDLSPTQLNQTRPWLNSELMRSGGGGGDQEEQVRLALLPKEEGLEKILQKADDLRLRTLKAILDVVTPVQAVHFLIAAAELHLRLHDWRKKKDARQHHGIGGN
uniref:DOG1 domain-containing protein n=1 Tax=Fagus sylvatica TaxID=28930 RepID=A0A2N9ILC8_FAGSY